MSRFHNDWLLLPQRIALHEPTATAVVADVHLGYSTVRQQLGDAVPCRNVEEELAPLASAAQTHDIRELVVAGDLFERGFDPAICQAFLDLLARLRIRFAGLAPGNHDRGLTNAPLDLPLYADGYDLAGWRVIHGDRPIDGERAVMGHWHPAVRWNGRKRPCFLTRGEQLVLPAFSLDAAGVDVSREPRWSHWQSHVILDGCVTMCTALRTNARVRGRGNRR